MIQSCVKSIKKRTDKTLMRKQANENYSIHYIRTGTYITWNPSKRINWVKTKFCFNCAFLSMQIELFGEQGIGRLTIRPLNYQTANPAQISYTKRWKLTIGKNTSRANFHTSLEPSNNSFLLLRPWHSDHVHLFNFCPSCSLWQRSQLPSPASIPQMKTPSSFAIRQKCRLPQFEKMKKNNVIFGYTIEVESENRRNNCPWLGLGFGLWKITIFNILSNFPPN